MQALFRTLVLFACAGLAQAHFFWVVPQEGGQSAIVVMSETLEPDPAVGVDYLGDPTVVLRDSEGNETPLTLTHDGDHFNVAVPGHGQRLIHGFADLGVMNRGTPHVLLYYAKTILGDAYSAPRVGDEAVVELVPVGGPDEPKLLLLARGEPRADAEITLVLPDGSNKVVKTDATGHSPVLEQSGRYGAWARFWEDKSGERDGKAYEQVRHYGMLVFDTDAPQISSADEGPEVFERLPEATSSFGSAVSDGWLYVYGGHVSPTHVYSTDAVSGRFHRAKLDGDIEWEELPSGVAVQGMNLAAHDGWIYLVGGMAPQNAPDEPTDNRSIDSVARFHPKKGEWQELPALPKPRSSHDVVVVGDELLVVGGWTMLEGGKQDWSETMLTMDLSKKKLAWEEKPQPFIRRALMAAAFDGKMYVVGGFTDKSEVKRTVSIYDPMAEEWSEGPELPEGGRTVGFAPAVGVHEGRLYVSVSDGTVWRLNEAGTAWEKAAEGAPRVAHRLASAGDALLVLGGAANGDNLDSIERLELDAEASQTE